MASTATFSRLVRRCTRYALGGLSLALAPLARCEEERKEEPFSKILDDAAAGKVQAVRVGADRCEITLKSGRSYDAKHVPWLGTDWLATRLREHGVRFGALTVPELTRDEKRRAVAKGLFAVLAPAAYLYFAYRILMKASRGPHQDESVANQYQRKKQRKRGFAGVAGVDKALRELREVVACLRDPAAFARIGARCPRGILLTGPSGTGKTLLARCVAEEADCEFLSCSGSAFVELFVGRGSARVRNLFAKARSLAPCVVFIDEIDAIAKARGMLSHNDEREQTLNQILCELDGFEAKDDDAAAAPLVVLLAATNRPEILDDALVRPGRLDRCVVVPLPDEAGRREILKVHAARVRLAPGVSLERVAARADGFSGADLANVVNEGALLAVRGSADAVTTEHLLDAVAKAQEAKRATRRRGFESIVPEAD